MVASSLPVDHRSKVRYPLVLNVGYRTLRRGQNVSGVGRTANMSSGGLLVDSPHEIDVGTKIEVRLEWPSRLDGVLPLQLVAVGTVARSEDGSFAVTLEKHQFRTMKRTPESSHATKPLIHNE